MIDHEARLRAKAEQIARNKKLRELYRPEELNNGAALIAWIREKKKK